MGKVDPNEAPTGYVAVESEGCHGCAFNAVGLTVCQEKTPCGVHRKDGRYVIFIKKPDDAVEVLREENDGLRAQVAALEAERDELAKQEPVAWMYDWQATEGLIRDWCTANQAEVSGPVINIRPLYARPAPAEPVNARMLEALKHILNGSLSLPRFAEEQARAAIAAAETRQAEPAGSLTLDKGEVEFLAARVRRLLAKFGVHEPEKDSRFIVGVAGSLIGNLLTNIELKEKAGMVRLSGDDQPAPVIIEGAPCRNALARDGKPYPKSSCQRCGTLLRSGWKCANGVEI